MLGGDRAPGKWGKVRRIRSAPFQISSICTRRHSMTEVEAYPNILERDSALINAFLKSVSEQPESFVAPSKVLSSQALKATKTLFDHGMSLEDL